MLHRRRLSARAFLILGALAGGSACSNSMTAPSPQTFAGNWVNVDPGTRSLVSITITDTLGALLVHPYGSCVPTSCDWGVVSAERTSEGSTAEYVATFIAAGCCNETVTLTLNAAGDLQTDTHTHFTDSSGRADDDAMDVFSKS